MAMAISPSKYSLFGCFNSQLYAQSDLLKPSDLYATKMVPRSTCGPANHICAGRQNSFGTIAGKRGHSNHRTRGTMEVVLQDKCLDGGII